MFFPIALDLTIGMTSANERAKSSQGRSLSRSPARDSSPAGGSSPADDSSPAREPRSAPKKAKEPKKAKPPVPDPMEEDTNEAPEDESSPPRPKKRTREALEDASSLIEDKSIHLPLLQRCSSASQARTDMIAHKADTQERNRVLVQFAPNNGQCDLALFEQLKQKYKKPSKKFKEYHQNKFTSRLGDIQPIKVEQIDMRKVFVVTAICVDAASHLITLEAFQKCLGQLLSFAKMKNASVHMVLDEDTPWNSDVSSFCQMVGKSISEEMKVDVYVYTDSDEPVNTSEASTTASPARKKVKTQGSSAAPVAIFTNVNAVLDGFDAKTEEKLRTLITDNGGKYVLFSPSLPQMQD